MQIKDAKIFFDAGRFQSVDVIEAPMGEGYHLSLIGKKVADNQLVSAQRGNGCPRVFKSIDAACRNAREIGFVTIEVHLSANYDDSAVTQS
ncbi:plasmid replication protein RepB [Vibrio parahaemolyticus]|nr:plasmid replication protein RepB [Vibrio parahaemolyticus]EKB1981112.1 plasmid replication protein RepB [Vibrio parahaemolyticus]ELI5395917.1 plasmid replication protein RepB [Vibrio parahaemolyticus]EME0847801.1 plasmid replication protein RepB [Vibrio parahaemolyticus]